MYNFYIVVFLIGVFYTFASLIISGVTGAFHSHGGDIGGHADGHFGHHGHVDAGHAHMHAGHGHSVDGGHNGADSHHGSAGENSSASSNLLSWFAMLLNPMVAVSFLTVLGGIGIIGERYLRWNDIIIFLMASGCAVIVSSILYNFIAKPIYNSENTSNVSREELIGVVAEVTTDILADGFGTINYTVNSIRHTAPAKHIDEKAVRQGEKVVICKIENNIFYISEATKVC